VLSVVTALEWPSRSWTVLIDSPSAVLGELSRDLGLPPPVALCLVVEDATADANPGGTDSDVAPVADGGRAGAEPVGHLFGGQQSNGHVSSSLVNGWAAVVLEKAPHGFDWCQG
jgi:hypothetical protein